MTELLSDCVVQKLPFLPQLLARPFSLASFLLDGGLPKLENVILPGRGPLPQVDVSAGLASAVVSWQELKWIRDLWRGPIVVKGILISDDGRRAIDEGAQAVVVSNHGGRQLDRVRASITALKDAASAVQGRAEVLVDGSVCRGSDLIKTQRLGSVAPVVMDSERMASRVSCALQKSCALVQNERFACSVAAGLAELDSSRWSVARENGSFRA